MSSEVQASEPFVGWRNAISALGDSGYRVLSGAGFARARGVDYLTVWKWLRAGRIPEAELSSEPGRPHRIPEDAIVLDRDLGREYAPSLAVLLHIMRHEEQPARRGWAITRAIYDLPEEQTRAFFETQLLWAKETEAEAACDRAMKERARERRAVPPLVNLRSLRRQRGIPQESLAGRVNLSQKAISRLELLTRRGSPARLGVAEKIARALSVAVEELWEGSTSSPEFPDRIPR